MKVFVLITGSYDEKTVEGVFSEEGMQKKIKSFSDKIDAWYEEKLRTAIKISEELEKKDIAEKNALKTQVKEKEVECADLKARISTETNEAVIAELKKKIKKLRHKIGRIGDQIAEYNNVNHYYGQEVHDIKNWTKEKKAEKYMEDYEIRFVEYVVDEK